MIDFVRILTVGLAALFFTSVIRVMFRSWGPWGSYWSSLVVMLLGLWAAQVWIEPMGLVYGGVAWLPLLLAGIYLSVLLIPLGATHQDSPGRQEEAFREAQAKQRREDRTFRLLDASFWWVLLVFALIIIVGYVTKT